MYPRQKINVKKAFRTFKPAYDFDHDMTHFIWIADTRMLKVGPCQQRFDAGFGLTIEDWT